MGQSGLQRLTIPAVLEESVARFGDRPALAVVGGETVTYAELSRRVDIVAELLRSAGIAAGDRVAILGENMPSWGVAYLAAVTRGMVAVPILPDFNPVEIGHILARSGARALFVSRRLYPKIEEHPPGDLAAVILLDDFTAVPPATRRDLLGGFLEEGRRKLARLGEALRGLAGGARPGIGETDAAAIIYTSGTTGFSKGVTLSHRNIVSNAMAAGTLVSLTAKDRMLSILPLSHAYEGTLGFIAPLWAGASVHYIDKPPTARVLLPAMQAVKPTVMLSVPLVLEKIVRTRIFPEIRGRFLLRTLSRFPPLRRALHRAAGRKLLASFGGELRCLCIGGAAIAPEVEGFLREARFPYAVGYGLTETAPLSTGTNPLGQRYLSCGPALAGVEVRIAGESVAGGIGEILVRGPNVMLGYDRDPARTKEAFTEDGWFRTGDLGLLDRDGCLFIKGRIKNMILGPSGENIYPEEVELIINECEPVLESVVFQREGQLAARVYLDQEKLDRMYDVRQLSETRVKEKIDALMEEIRLRVNGRVSAFSRIVRMIRQAEPFEKTPTQKIKRTLYS